MLNSAFTQYYEKDELLSRIFDRQFQPSKATNDRPGCKPQMIMMCFSMPMSSYDTKSSLKLNNSQIQQDV